MSKTHIENQNGEKKNFGAKENIEATQPADTHTHQGTANDFFFTSLVLLSILNG